MRSRKAMRESISSHYQSTIMKKTLITLMALAGVAIANPTVLRLDNLLDSQAVWTTVNGSANWGTSGQVSVNGWNVGVFQYTLDAAYTLDADTSLVFSYDLHIAHNAALTLTLISEDQAIVTGWGGFDTTHQVAMGVTDTIAPGFYNFKDTGDKFVTVDVAKVIETSSNYRSYDGTVTGEIKWSEEVSKFVCTLATNDTNAQTIELGTTFTLNSIVLCASGNAGGTPASNLSNLSLFAPEPTTASLSLLALAALAARRKRH